jgi:fermentation-respiration switch protein FrsA (DUF1100 family)
VFYQPAKNQFLDPARFKLTYREVQFPSKDKTMLAGWFFPAKAKKAKGTIIQFHGNAQNMSTHFLSLIWLVSEGYNLFTFDYHGYGQSGGEPSQRALYEDALAALDVGLKLNEENGGGKYIAFGQSLGGNVALRALADYKDLGKVDLIVQDSTFSSYTGIAFDKLTDRWFLVPFSPLAYLLVSNAYASEKVFKKINRPTLVIVGQKDVIIPQKFGKKIYRKVAASEKWLMKIPEGSHIDAFHVAGGKYRQPFLDLLDKLPQP